MGQPPQRGFNAANENGGLFITAADQIAVYHRGIIRPLSRHTAGGEGVITTAALCHGIVVHHGIHIAAHDQKTQTGFPEHPDALRILPVRLGDDTHFIAVGFQYPADDGMTEGGMIHVGIPDDIYKITLFPAPLFHLFTGHRQKFAHGKSPFHFCN